MMQPTEPTPSTSTLIKPAEPTPSTPTMIQPTEPTPSTSTLIQPAEPTPSQRRCTWCWFCRLNHSRMFPCVGSAG
jgi:hypothetical protein